MLLMNHNNYGYLIIASVSVTVILMSLCIIILALIANRRIKKANADLYYQEELFHMLGSNVADIFVIYDATHKRFEYISPNLEKMTGMKSEILIENYMNLLNYVPEQEKIKILDLINHPVYTEAKQFEFQYDSVQNGRKKWLQLRVYPTVNQNVFRYIACVSNITKEKEAQFLIEESLQKVQKANEAKKEFLSHVSHELKTPINAIIGMTQIARNNINDSKISGNCLNKIDYASDRLLTMINNILDMAKIDSHKLMLSCEPFSLCELIAKFSSMVSIQAEAQNKIFTLALKHIQDDVLYGDSNRLIQIIENCISNALKFTPPGGKIRLEVTQTERVDTTAKIRFSISDNGKGMSEEYLEKIFLPFEQENPDISKTYGGTGLGMSIAKSLVNLMDGKIEVVSKIDQGTTVTIDIPFRSICASGIEKQDIPKKYPDDYDYSGNRALVVEDNEINLEITREFLKYLNINVETASDGYQAIRQFEASETGYYDYILMDLKMSKLDGYETTKAIRSSKHPDAKKVCIIAMTADNFAETATSLEYGMNYHITKPIDMHYFCSILHNIKNNTPENEIN